MRYTIVLSIAFILVLIGVDYQIRHPGSSLALPEEEDREVALCFPALFSFGSSIADTGTYWFALGDPKYMTPPYGCTFFGEPSGRVCDGRALIDFWATALSLPFLDPYLKSIGSNFRRGANFACSGSLATKPLLVYPFDLTRQVNQFRGFKRQVLDIIESKCQGSRSQAQQNECRKWTRREDFGDALYVLAVGGNDLFDLFFNVPMQEIPALVPRVSQAIFEAVEVLYSEGARNILIEDVYPQGCTPIIFDRLDTNSRDLDNAGCFTPVNSIVKLHNSLLKEGVTELISRLPDASIAVIDTYTPRYEIISQYKKYGFTYQRHQYLNTSAAPAVLSGDIEEVVGPGGSMQDAGGRRAHRLSKCVNVSQYIMWDNIHFTDSVNLLTMRQILLGKHFYPSFDIVRNNCAMVEV